MSYSDLSDDELIRRIRRLIGMGFKIKVEFDGETAIQRESITLQMLIAEAQERGIDLESIPNQEEPAHDMQ